MRTILVTGGAGFIGSNFVHFLYRKYPEDKIIVLDSLTYAGSVNNLPPQRMKTRSPEFIYGSVINQAIVDNAVAQSDIVVHFAAESHVTRSIHDNRLFFETDVLGTHTVANSILKHRDRIRLFIHISTSEVYGSAITEKMSEDHPLNPMSPYASAKCGADRLVYSYWKTFQIPAVIVRPFNNYGPRQHLEKLVPRFVTGCLLGEPLRVHGDGEASRDWLFVEDHCEAIDRMLDTDPTKLVGQVFNIGTERSISIGEIAEIVRAKMNAQQVPIVYVNDRPGQVFRHTADTSKIREHIGWQPRTSFEHGIEQTIRWYQTQRDWWSSQLWMREITITLPEGRKVAH